MPMIMQLDSTSWLDNLKSETSIIVAIFLLVGLYALKSAPAIIQSFKGLFNDKSEPIPVERLLAALQESATAKSELVSVINGDLHENREIRRHFHIVKNYLTSLQGVLEIIVDHLEYLRGKRLTKERTLLNTAGDILREDNEGKD